jgi:hypothetical protein
MLGGAGNDTYVINALTDIINEEAMRTPMTSSGRRSRST